MYNNQMTLVEAHNAAAMEKENKEREHIAKIKMEREKQEKFIKEFSPFINDCKLYFLAESYVKIIDKSMRESSIDYDKNICRNLLYQYFGESKIDLTLKKMEETTQFLSELSCLIKSSVQKIEESCDRCNNSTFNIKNSINTEFFDKLNSMSNDQMTKAICTNVQKGTSDFVEGVIKDKKYMEDTATTIKDKVDKLKPDTDDSVKEGYYKTYERRIHENRDQRPKNLLEHLVYGLSKNSIKNDSLKQVFVNEGKIDMDHIQTVANSIYITLEAMNTTRLKEMDKVFFNEVVKSIK